MADDYASDELFTSSDSETGAPIRTSGSSDEEDDFVSSPIDMSLLFRRKKIMASRRPSMDAILQQEPQTRKKFRATAKATPTTVTAKYGFKYYPVNESDRKVAKGKATSKFVPNGGLDVTPKSRFCKTSSGVAESTSSSATDFSMPLTTNDDGEVVAVLREITATLNTLVKRVEATESGLRKVQNKLDQSSPSSSSESSSSAKTRVPLIVRVSNSC